MVRLIDAGILIRKRTATRRRRRPGPGGGGEEKHGQLTKTVRSAFSGLPLTVAHFSEFAGSEL